LEREGNGDTYQDYVTQIQDLYTTMKFADIDFVVGTERFSAHKLILATRAPFFAKLFNSKFSLKLFLILIKMEAKNLMEQKSLLMMS